MAKYTIEDATLTAIADAIRAKTGGTETLTPQEMVSSIKEIPLCFPNGTSWTKVSSNSSLPRYNLYYANGRWLAGAANLDTQESIDGITWTSNLAIPKLTCNPVYERGIWVVGSSDGIYYSKDFETWTLSNVTGSISTINYADGMWHAAVNNNTFGLYYSTDGMVWEQSSTAGICKSVRKEGGIWVASDINTSGSQYSPGAAYSLDGINWTQSNLSRTNCSELTYANGLWVLPTDDGLYYSNDGKVWTLSNITDGMEYSKVINANGIWLAATDIKLYFSNDGKEWTVNENNSMSGRKIAYSNGIWLRGDVSTNGIFYSTDSIIWKYDDSITANVYAFVNANGIWVAATDNGLYYSITWAPPSS